MGDKKKTIMLSAVPLLQSSRALSSSFVHFPEVSRNLGSSVGTVASAGGGGGGGHPSFSPSHGSSNPFVFSDQHQRTFPLRKSR